MEDIAAVIRRHACDARPFDHWLFPEQIIDQNTPLDRRDIFGDKNELIPDRLEVRIVEELWRWSNSDEAERAKITPNSPSLSSMIEFYLCGLFWKLKSTYERSCWCDGVVEVTISETAPSTFFIVGAAYWAPGRSDFYLAPFELEFHFRCRGDQEAERIIWRFGRDDHHGRIVQVRHTADARHLIETRPTRTENWAIAIELS